MVDLLAQCAAGFTEHGLVSIAQRPSVSKNNLLRLQVSDHNRLPKKLTKVASLALNLLRCAVSSLGVQPVAEAGVKRRARPPIISMHGSKPDLILWSVAARPVVDAPSLVEHIDSSAARCGDAFPSALHTELPRWLP